MNVMNVVKSIFVMIYIPALVFGAGKSSYILYTNGMTYQWLGALIATLVPAVIIVPIFAAANKARLPSVLPWMTAAVVGSAVAIFGLVQGEEPTKALIYCFGFGITGSFLYNFWYSRLGDRTKDQVIEVGKKLPAFELSTTSGESFSSKDLQGSPVLMMFYRGNWCPLCMAQIKEVVAQYKELSAKGVRVLLVSSQPDDNTEGLAKKFEVPFEFMVDKDNRAAESLKILHKNGTPMGLQVRGYTSDTAMPTVVITDAKGKVIFADLTDNYRLRPEPDVFIDVLNAAGI